VDSRPDGTRDRIRPDYRARVLAFAGRHWVFLLVLVLAVGLRLTVQLAYDYAFYFPDSRGYVTFSLTRQLDQFHPAGYSYFLKPFVPGPLNRVALLQHLLGVGLVVAGYVFLTRRGVRPWIAALAVTPVAIDSLEVDLEHFITAETLFIVLLAGALFGLTWRQKVPAVSAAVAGLLLAGAVLTRTIGQPLVILLLISVAVGMYEPRYSVGAVFLLPIAAALATLRLGRARAPDEASQVTRTALAKLDTLAKP
jgi:Dolichyl-phosphate-mannose-protein mannosyltransferase